MRIIYLSEALPPVMDGVTRTLTQLAKTLEAEGLDFRFISAFLPPDEAPWRKRVVRVASVAFPPYPYYRVNPNAV